VAAPEPTLAPPPTPEIIRRTVVIERPVYIDVAGTGFAGGVNAPQPAGPGPQSQFAGAPAAVIPSAPSNTGAPPAAPTGNTPASAPAPTAPPPAPPAPTAPPAPAPAPAPAKAPTSGTTKGS
jgi:translation initiation factor IF-2